MSDDSDEYFEPEDDYLEPEDSYIDPSDDSYLEPEDDYLEDDDDIESEEKITIRGPGYTGHESFDQYLIFGNEVELSSLQVTKLNSFVEQLPTMPPIKIYVSRLEKSQTKPPDCKMEFSTDFTCQYLLPLLKPPTSPDPLSSLVVQSPETADGKHRYCRMRLESGKGKITTGWIAVVQGCRLKEGDICLFCFKDERALPPKERDPFGIKTRLVLLRLEEATNAGKITIRGPGHVGHELIDINCVFGNEVHMPFNQTNHLNKLVDVKPRPKIKEYVCTITKQNVRPECKMEFTAEFTSYYLTEILRSPTGLPLVSLVINCTESTKDRYCWIKIGDLGKATIAVGWIAAVQTFNLREGDICMFSFKDERIYGKRGRDSLAWLRLIITRLDVESYE